MKTCESIFREINEEHKSEVLKNPEFPKDTYNQALKVFYIAKKAAGSAYNHKNHHGNIETVRKRLIQTAAMCVRCLR